MPDPDPARPEPVAVGGGSGVAGPAVRGGFRLQGDLPGAPGGGDPVHSAGRTGPRPGTRAGRTGPAGRQPVHLPRIGSTRPGRGGSAGKGHREPAVPRQRHGPPPPVPDPRQDGGAHPDRGDPDGSARRLALSSVVAAGGGRPAPPAPVPDEVAATG